MALIDLWRRFGRESVIHYECHTCGTTLTEDEVRCSACGSQNIVKYEWSD